MEHVAHEPLGRPPKFNITPTRTIVLDNRSLRQVFADADNCIRGLDKIEKPQIVKKIPQKKVIKRQCGTTKVEILETKSKKIQMLVDLVNNANKPLVALDMIKHLGVAHTTVLRYGISAADEGKIQQNKFGRFILFSKVAS